MPLRTVLIAVAAVTGALASACASEGPPPREAMAKAHTLVDQADKADAQRYAAADLQRAHDELSTAEREFGAQKYTEASMAAESAAADADLANARASAAQAQRAATEVSRSNSAVAQEADHQAANPSPVAPPR